MSDASPIMFELRMSSAKLSEIVLKISKKIIFNFYPRLPHMQLLVMLFPAEEFIFQMELYECKPFFDHVRELIDDNSSGQISSQEWLRI